MNYFNEFVLQGFQKLMPEKVKVPCIVIFVYLGAAQNPQNIALAIFLSRFEILPILKASRFYWSAVAILFYHPISYYWPFRYALIQVEVEGFFCNSKVEIGGYVILFLKLIIITNLALGKNKDKSTEAKSETKVLNVRQV